MHPAAYIDAERRRGRAAGCLAASLLWLGAAGCRTAPAPELCLDVPFHAQDPSYCGSAALTMVLRHYGVAVAYEELVRQVHVPALEGTVAGLLAAEARRLGLEAEVVRLGGRQQLADWLRRGIPPIVFLAGKSDPAQGHFAVVTGLDRAQRAVRVHSGTRRHRWRRLDRLLERWAAGRFVTVVIEPPKGAPS